MMPFGGKFRVVDFTLRNSNALGAAYTILYNDIDDGLDKYIIDRDIFDDGSVAHLVRVVSSRDVPSFQNLIDETNTTHYILYNGDNPSIIDFRNLISRFTKKGADAMIYLIDIDGKTTMANKILVAKRKALQKAVKKALKENRQTPNLIEMIINMVINQGVNKGEYRAHYWPVNNIPDYYNITREIVWNKEIFSLLYKDKIIKSRINAEGYARIGKNAEVVNSFISDFCQIDGKVDNSIIYPGVIIEEKTEIKDSILLPFVHIAHSAKVVRSIVDENTEPDGKPNVGIYCDIGTNKEQLRNGDFPKSIFSSITLLGKNCHIPDRITIGGACYVASNASTENFGKNRVIHDGVSII
jgi:ADP-glucose pyrophosphorylase